MVASNKLKLLLFDNKYLLHRGCYAGLSDRNVDITLIDDYKELEKMNLTDFHGFIAHPGLENQREFVRMMQKYPTLKTMVVTDSLGAYKTSSDMNVCDVSDIEGLYNYFATSSNA